MMFGMPIVPMCSTLGGCIMNSFALEIVMQQCSTSGQLLNVCRFAVVGLLHYFERAFVYDSRNGGRGLGPIRALMPLSIPFNRHIILASIYLFMNVLNSAVFAFGISQALHVVIRSATPLANILVGFLFFSKRYSLAQCLCLVFVTLGAVITTSAGAIAAMWTDPSGRIDDNQVLAQYFIGIGLLAVSMLLTGILAHFQEKVWKEKTTVCRIHLEIYDAKLRLYSKQYYMETSQKRPGCPRDWQEGLIYQNLLSIPFFVLAGSNLSSATRAWNSSPPVCYQVGYTVPFDRELASYRYSISSWSLETEFEPSKFPLLNLPPIDILPRNVTFCIPRTWLYVMMDIFSMPVCLRGVHSLTAAAGGLKACVIMTLRKCLTLALSVAVFENRFTLHHWIGTFVVFAGSFVFSFLPSIEASKNQKLKVASKID